MKILRKIIEANAPVSAQAMAKMVSASIKSERDIAEMAKVLDGLKIANGQQAEMLASLVNQVSGLQMVKAEKQEKGKEKIEYDEAFQ